jgi:hypothetical protein
MKKETINNLTKFGLVVTFFSTIMLGYLYYQKIQKEKEDESYHLEMKKQLSDIEKRLEDHKKSHEKKDPNTEKKE